MSIFDKFKVYAQNSQNTQKSENETKKGIFVNIVNIVHESSPLKNDFSKNTQSSTTPPKNATLEADPKNKISSYKQISQTPIYELIGDYKSEAHLIEDLLKYPQCVPCLQRGWAWFTKDRCANHCKEIPEQCIYWSVAPFKPIEISEYDLC